MRLMTSSRSFPFSPKDAVSRTLLIRRYDALEFPKLHFQPIRRDPLDLDLVVVPLRGDIRRRGGERLPGRGINNEALSLVVRKPSEVHLRHVMVFPRDGHG